MVENPPANVGDARHAGSSPGQEDPLEEEEMATTVSLPGKSRGQRSLEGHRVRHN